MIDQSTDLGGRHLYRIQQTYRPPEFVKTAAATDLVSSDPLPAECYGDPGKHLFSCHTPAATWLSYAYFLDQQDQYADKQAAAVVKERIQKLGAFHSIARHLEALDKRASDLKTVVSDERLPDSDYALVLELPDGSKDRHYRVCNSQEVKLAADYLIQYRHRLPFHLRQKMAETVLQKAEEYAARLDDNVVEELEKSAGHGRCAAREAAELLYSRVRLTIKHGSPQALTPVQVEMLKLAKEGLEHPDQFRKPGSLVKTAEVVDAFDRAHNLCLRYGEADVPLPEEILFGVTREKMASLVRDHTETITGNIYKLADLSRVRARDVRDALGDDYADSMSSDGIHLDSDKVAEVVPTMPRPDAELLDGLLTEVGVKAFAKNASADVVKMSETYLRKMAEERRQELRKEKKPGKALQAGSLFGRFSR